MYIREQDEPVNVCQHTKPLLIMNDRMTHYQCEDCGKQFTDEGFGLYLDSLGA